MTIKQKLTSIISSNSIRFVKEVDDTLVLCKREEGVPLLVYSDNEYSPHYPIHLSNTGMMDIKGNSTKFKGIARREKTRGGAQTVYVEKEVYDKNVEIHAELGGHPTTHAYLIHEDKVRKVMNRRDTKLLQVGASSVSESRAGSLVVIPAGIDLLDYVENQLRYDMHHHIKRASDTELTFNLVKAYSRLKLASSSGKELKLFDGYVYHEGAEETKIYKGIDGEVQSTQVILTKEGDDDAILEVIPQDFEVKMKQSVIMPQFSSKNKTVGITKEELSFTRVATDGAVYIDAHWAAKHGLKSAAQFRFTTVGKGLMVPVPNLKALTGSTMLLFEGAVKGDILLSLRQNQLDFFVLRRSRHTRSENSLLLSRQVFGAIALDNPEIIRGLTKETALMLQRVYSHDVASLKEFVGIDNTEIEEEEVLDSDNLTVELFKANPEAFLKSHSLVRKLDSLIRSSTGEIERGARLYLKDASIKHMIVDPLTIVSFISKGYIGIDADKVKQRGVAAGHFITSGLSEYDTFYVEHEKAFLARFPFLHHMEGRLVNESGEPFIDSFTADLYQSFIVKGMFQGLGIYSLWDMNPEGQSGADFDGDETVYTTNPILVDNFNQQPLFLDYSKVDDDVVEGVPWKGHGLTPKLNELVNDKTQTIFSKLGVSYAEGQLTFPSSLLDKDGFRRTAYQMMMKIAGLTNQPNYIGLFTNVNSAVMELLYRLKAMIRKIDAQDELTPALSIAKRSIQLEIDGYEKLSFLLTCAIRWEIDKAKHGGDFMEKLPFLSFIVEGVSDREQVREVEEAFGVSLERLFFGNVK